MLIHASNGESVTKEDLAVAYVTIVRCGRYARKLKPMARRSAAKACTNDSAERYLLEWPNTDRMAGNVSADLRARYEALLAGPRYRFPPSGRPGDRAKIEGQLRQKMQGLRRAS